MFDFLFGSGYISRMLLRFGTTTKSPKNAAKINYLLVRQHRQRSKIKWAKYF